jgi:hypothetical protein
MPPGCVIAVLRAQQPGVARVARSLSNALRFLDRRPRRAEVDVSEALVRDYHFRPESAVSHVGHAWNENNRHLRSSSRLIAQRQDAPTCALRKRFYGRLA